MPTLRIALAQVNSTVGDLPGNAASVRRWSRAAADAGAQLVAFPEMMLTGYPIEDLVFRDSFVSASQRGLVQLAADLAADGLGDLAVLVGYVDTDETGRRDAAALLIGGVVTATYYKHHLPNYGVFDEDRYFEPGETLTVVRFGGVDIGLSVCEDIWQAGGPFAAARRAGVGLVVNINASPYELNKDDVRLPLVRRRAAEADATVAYVNLIGGQDELVFDGDSMIVTAGGDLLTRGGQFTSELIVHDLDLPLGADNPGEQPATDDGMAIHRVDVPVAPRPLTDGPAAGGIAERVTDEAEIWSALTLGLHDYVEKNGFRSVVLGLSGGIDSAVVAAIAVDALGADRVTCVSMPSGHSSVHSKDDAADLAKRTGLDYRIEPIQPMVDAFLANMSLSGLAVENLQARVRGVILMALSNQEGHLVLTTGNKSELAVGYSTLYGDSVGGFNPLKDVPKTMVWKLARWRNADAARRGEEPPIPESSITKAPSAELRPGQVDTDSLPDYSVLDPILLAYIDGDQGRDQLIEAGHDAAIVDRTLRMVDLAEYKRRQSAPGTKISIKAFGRDRRLPITNRFREGV
ncbi:NAD+ synthase [Actinoplanes sp. NBRC 103695]|uniref:NAD+ synthase n=1 Tax=Actinoplanes sp. NBRC 103695 TaxID=3032202 RepID=UPI0024A39631|nr:NAD+ synthase [Actinoplanes sp. NBRC 103695]GLY94168.1 NAD+ synthase (glutamine-hydrolysing) [Actinoplanes sp. NBRC 103695]